MVYLNGELVAAARARLAIDDAGFEQGDGLFETLRVEEGAAMEIDAHMERLVHGLRRLDLEVPETAGLLGDAVEQVAATAPRPVSRLRVTVSRGTPRAGPTRLVRATCYQGPHPIELERGVPVIGIGTACLDSTGPLAGIKSTSYGLLAQCARQAAAAGAYEGLLANERGELVEATRCNVVALVQDRVVTPPLSSGCLPGIVRGLLLEAGKVEEDLLRFDALARVSSMALTNSLIGVLPVASIDGRELRVAEPIARLGGELASLRVRGRR